MRKIKEMEHENIMENYYILAINPGSTSTKISLYRNEEYLLVETLRHDVQELSKFNSVMEQLEYRKGMIMDFLKKNNIDINLLSAVSGRGGFLKPISSGVYKVNDRMCQDLFETKTEHASNLGGLIAKSIADDCGIPSYVVDPVAVDEIHELGKVSGLKGTDRYVLFHCLNAKAVGRKAAARLNGNYETKNFVIAHIGGGISVSAHKKGVAIDSTMGIFGEGSFSVERAGTLSQRIMLDLCFDSGKSRKEIEKILAGNGGLVSYLGSNNCLDIEDRINNGDDEARLYYEAMAYQISKDIAAQSSVLSGEVDAICITGGIAHSMMITDWIINRVRYIAPVLVFPGEFEQEALSFGVLRVLRKEIKAKTYI
jgi:butyrate kinase